MDRVNHLNVFLVTILAWVAFSCSESDAPDNNYQPQNYNVSGKVEKGPFISGSTITVQTLNARMQPVGEMYSSIIQDNMGGFTFGSKLFNAPFAELMANGYFFNEVSGELSSGTLNLRAIVDLSDQSTIHVNILTHLKCQRVLNLVEQGYAFKEANARAQEELFAAFGLSRYAATDASRFSVVGGDDEAAALIAVSSLLLVGKSEAMLTEYLAGLCREFGQTGGFTAETRQRMKADLEELWKYLPKIRDNVVGRYGDLGLSVKVKELEPFFDWDGDGVAGNEILKEGEEVTMEATRIEVPCEGGSYRIRITSPVPVYLHPTIGVGDMSYESVFENMGKLYEDVPVQEMSVEKELEGDVLTITVAPLNSRTRKETTVYIYNCIGTVLGTVDIIQEGNADLPVYIPLLGSAGKSYVDGMIGVFTQAMSEYNLLEQLYHYNKQADCVKSYIVPNSSSILNCWGLFYKVNRYNLTLKYQDASLLGVYQDICNVFSAMQYYYMLTAWGDVPYITDYDWYQTGNLYIGRTAVAKILERLEREMRQAVEGLQDKKNEPFEGVNGCFLVSKDVARVLLADIYMYQGKYADAEMQLYEVIKNGFYGLDDSNYSKQETIDRLLSDKGGKEILFALQKASSAPRSYSDISILSLPVVPIQTYTEVILSYAECLYKQGRVGDAARQLEEVIAAKNIHVGSDDVLDGIAEARQQLLLYGVGNFAFMKRNGMAQEMYGVEEYRLLFPIPLSELSKNPKMTQNPGY